MYPDTPHTIPIFERLQSEIDFIKDALLKYELAIQHVHDWQHEAGGVSPRDKLDHAGLQKFDLAVQILEDLAEVCRHMKDAQPSFCPPPVPDSLLRLERSRRTFSDSSGDPEARNTDRTDDVQLF